MHRVTLQRHYKQLKRFKKPVRDMVGELAELYETIEKNKKGRNLKTHLRKLCESDACRVD